MDIENDVLAESNDGANWRKGAKKNTKAKVLLASSKYGSVSSFLNGLKLVSPVGARGLPRDDPVETKCLATRHATIIGFDKRDNETGVWILTGNLESHERYADVKARHPTKSAAEILQLAGGTYHENWEDHPIARAVRRGEPAPTRALPSLMDMINSGELEKNNYTLALAAEELSKKSIDASTDPPIDSFPGISQRDSEDHEDPSLKDKRQAATSDAEPVDSFPWISTRDVEESEGGSSEKEREMIRSEDVDGFPWIVTRDGDELNGDSSVEKRDVDVSEEVDSFPWIN